MYDPLLTHSINIRQAEANTTGYKKLYEEFEKRKTLGWNFIGLPTYFGACTTKDRIRIMNEHVFVSYCVTSIKPCFILYETSGASLENFRCFFSLVTGDEFVRRRFERSQQF